MKLMIASDLHGSLTSCKKMLELYEQEKAEKLLLLGDTLYHGPRNPLPEGYGPKEVFRLLNGMRRDILCVRGNCDSEVDQMVLEFPIMADYIMLDLDGIVVFATHGHIYNKENPPMISRGEILLHGHTHVPALEETDQYIYLNPGSVTMRHNDRTSYIMYEDGVFLIKDMADGGVMQRYPFR